MSVAPALPLAVSKGSVSGPILLAGVASLLICLFLSPKFIELLRNREFGQNIREEGPAGHQTKAGTPTMGGVIIFTAIAVPYLLLSKLDWLSLSVFGVAIACALMGFADDYMKIVRRRSLGLRARTKLLLTVAISVALWWVATHKAGISSTIQLRPFDVSVDFGPLFPVFIYLVVAGTTTAVNFTDGLDGLAAGCTAIAGLAIMTDTETLLIVLGGIFVIEVLSVVIQVFSFQTFRKRVFLMAPIHHHFELKAWSETKIILRFWIVAAAFGAIGFVLYQLAIRG
jgi:phospho-N-acetylmuramoyl-pentapeptide-transferase